MKIKLVLTGNTLLFFYLSGATAVVITLQLDIFRKYLLQILAGLLSLDRYLASLAVLIPSFQIHSPLMKGKRVGSI